MLVKLAFKVMYLLKGAASSSIAMSPFIPPQQLWPITRMLSTWYCQNLGLMLGHISLLLSNLGKTRETYLMINYYGTYIEDCDWIFKGGTNITVFCLKFFKDKSFL